MNILALIGIAIGGAIGALSRGLLTRMLKRHLLEQFPFATLIVNLIACFAAGMVMPLTLNEALYLRSSARLRTSKFLCRLIDQQYLLPR